MWCHPRIGEKEEDKLEISSRTTSIVPSGHVDPARSSPIVLPAFLILRGGQQGEPVLQATALVLESAHFWGARLPPDPIASPPGCRVLRGYCPQFVP